MNFIKWKSFPLHIINIIKHEELHYLTKLIWIVDHRRMFCVTKTVACYDVSRSYLNPDQVCFHWCQQIACPWLLPSTHTLSPVTGVHYFLELIGQLFLQCYKSRRWLVQPKCSPSHWLAESCCNGCWLVNAMWWSPSELDWPDVFSVVAFVGEDTFSASGLHLCLHRQRPSVLCQLVLWNRRISDHSSVT